MTNPSKGIVNLLKLLEFTTSEEIVYPFIFGLCLVLQEQSESDDDSKVGICEFL